MDAMYKVDPHILEGSSMPTGRAITISRWIRSARGGCGEEHAEAADTAESLDIVLAMETVNRFEQYIINSAEEAVEFVKRDRERECKGNAGQLPYEHRGRRTREAIRRTGNSLGHFHIGEGNRKCRGKGTCRGRKMGARRCGRPGTDGAVVMEPFVKMGGTVGKRYQGMAGPVGRGEREQMDEDIREALRFVKKQFVE